MSTLNLITLNFCLGIFVGFLPALIISLVEGNTIRAAWIASLSAICLFWAGWNHRSYNEYRAELRDMEKR